MPYIILNQGKSDPSYFLTENNDVFGIFDAMELEWKVFYSYQGTTKDISYTFDFEESEINIWFMPTC